MSAKTEDAAPRAPATQVGAFRIGALMAVDVSAMTAAPEATPGLEPSAPPEGAPTAAVTTETTPVAPVGEAASPAPETVEVGATPTTPAPQSIEDRFKATGKTLEELEAGSRSERSLAREVKAHRTQTESEAKAAEEAAFQQRLDEALARARKAEEEQSAREAADKAAREKYAKFYGSPEEIAELQRVANQVVPIIGDYDTVDDIAAKNKTISEINAARARLTEYSGRYEMREELRSELSREIWGSMAAAYETGATLPDVDAEAYRKAPDVPSALRVLRDSVAAARDAHWQAIVDDLKADLEIERSERETAQAAAGGRGPQPAAGGTGGGGHRIYTRERLREMMQSPEGLAEYRANRAEIERQEAAGLII